MKNILLTLSLFALSAPAFATANLKCVDLDEGYEIHGLLASGELGTKPFHVTMSKGGGAPAAVKVVDYLESRAGEFLNLIVADPATGRILAIVDDLSLTVLNKKGELVGRYGVQCEIN